MKIVITLPKLTNMGGVANYYNSILPILKNKKELTISTLEVGKTHGKKNFFHPIYDQLNFNRILKLNKPDIVHINPYLNFNSFVRDGLFIWQAKKRKIPVIVFWRGCKETFADMIEKNIFLSIFFKRTFLTVDMTLVLASDFKQKLLLWGLKSKIKLSTTTVDDSLLENFNISSKLKAIQKSEEIRILFLSNIIREKGIFETLDAFNILLKKFNIHLDIAGEGSDLIAAKRYSEKLKIPGNKISFLGYVRGKKKEEVLNNNHIYCFPTYYGEGMPNSVLEAMAFGMPVVTRPAGGIKNFFEHKKMGFITKSKSADKIAYYIESLIIDKKLFCQIAEYNYNYAKKKFLSPMVAERLKESYKIAANQKIKNKKNSSSK